MGIINTFNIGETVFVPVTENKKAEARFIPYAVNVHVLEGEIDEITVMRPTVEEDPFLMYRVRSKADSYTEVWCREWQMFRTAGELYNYMTKLFKLAAKEFDCGCVLSVS